MEERPRNLSATVRNWQTGTWFPCTILALAVALASAAMLIVLLVRGNEISNDINSFVELFISQRGLVMDPACDDQNDCTWDFMLGADEHCESHRVKNNYPCADTCLVPASGTCQTGECVGTCPGECETSADCPDLPAHSFLPVVDFGGNAICVFGKCIYAYFNVDDVFPVSSAVCHQLHSTNSLRGCTDLISPTLAEYSKDCIQSTWCDFGLVDDVCLFTFECSSFNFGSELIATNETAPVISYANAFSTTDIINEFKVRYNYTSPE